VGLPRNQWRLKLKINVKHILFILIVAVFCGCTDSKTSENVSNLVKIINYEDLDKTVFTKGNIYIIPENRGDHSAYYIQGKTSGMYIQVDEPGVIRGISFEDNLKDERVSTVRKVENNSIIWEIYGPKEQIVIKINKDDSSDFEIIRSKKE